MVSTERARGMEKKTEKTKEQRIKQENTRLRGIYKELDENKKKIILPLIQKAAFMHVELEDLQAHIAENGITEEYQNGENQHGRKRSPEADVYIALTKNYTAIIKQLTELAPAAPRKKSKLEMLREED